MMNKNKTLATDIIRYFGNADCPAGGITKNGLFHYSRSRSYFNDLWKIDRIWKDITYYLSKMNYDFIDKTILDVGCGTGYTSIYFTVTGARRVVGLDLRESKIEAFRKYAGYLPENLRQRIEIIRGDIQSFSNLDQFDVIYAQEAISHIVDDNLFQRFYRILKKDGLLFIKDGNSELCKPYMARLKEFWNRVENGPKGKLHGFEIEFVYRDIRKELITRWYGDAIKSEVIEMLAAKTAYLSGDNIKKACDRYLNTGIAPNYEYIKGTSPVHPDYGYYADKSFNPFEVKKQLLMIGFKECHIYGPTGYLRGPLTRFLFRIMPLSVQLRIQPSFTVIAKK